jgi:hypothetical protein
MGACRSLLGLHRLVSDGDQQVYGAGFQLCRLFCIITLIVYGGA